MSKKTGKRKQRRKDQPAELAPPRDRQTLWGMKSYGVPMDHGGNHPGEIHKATAEKRRGRHANPPRCHGAPEPLQGFGQEQGKQASGTFGLDSRYETFLGGLGSLLKSRMSGQQLGKARRCPEKMGTLCTKWAHYPSGSIHRWIRDHMFSEKRKGSNGD